MHRDKVNYSLRKFASCLLQIFMEILLSFHQYVWKTSFYWNYKAPPCSLSKFCFFEEHEKRDMKDYENRKRISSSKPEYDFDLIYGEKFIQRGAFSSQFHDTFTGQIHTKFFISFYFISIILIKIFSFELQNLCTKKLLIVMILCIFYQHSLLKFSLTCFFGIIIYAIFCIFWLFVSMIWYVKLMINTINWGCLNFEVYLVWILFITYKKWRYRNVNFILNFKYSLLKPVYKSVESH